MDVKIGDIYIRESDGRACKVKKLDNKTVILEFEDGIQSITDVFGLERAYTNQEQVE